MSEGLICFMEIVPIVRVVAPARPLGRRVRIGLAEWECHDMPDGSEVLLPRGGGARGMQAERFVIETAPRKWVALSTAKRGAYVQTGSWHQAYKCSRETAETVAAAIRRGGNTATVVPVPA